MEQSTPKLVNVYLDINVVVDILDSKRKNHYLVHNLLKFFILNNIEIIISEDMLSTIFYIVKNKKKVLEFFDVIVEDWKIVSLGENVIKKAIAMAKSNNFDLEDTLQCLCAKENKCDVLITNDFEFNNCGMKIYSIEEFLAAYVKPI